MKRGIFLALSLILALSILSSFTLAAPKPQANPCPITSTTDFAFYGETGFGGVGTPSRSWMVHFLDWWKTQDPSISYVELDANDLKSDCNLASFPNLQLYIQPGGNAYYQQNKLGSTGKSNILNHINAGKAYFGTCAGFYYAAGDYHWQGDYYNWADLLGIYPTLEGSITNIADYDQNPGYALTGLSNGFNAIYYGGPTRGWRDTPSSVLGTVDSTFSSIPGNLPAVIKHNKMLLTSVHLEAFENDGITGLTTEQRVENYKYLANLINEVAGTSYYVPPYTTPPAPKQCGDNLDNDGDNLIDLADPGCTSSSDDDETDPLPMQCADGLDNDGDTLTDLSDPGCLDSDDNDETDVTGPAELFFDDFENGLSAWTLQTVSGGNSWQSVTTNPFQGAKHAESKPMSTSEPASNMEKSISTSGYNTIEISYNRKLIGLDIADEFKVKWFNGISWTTLEQTGSSSANDPSYLSKTYTVPGNNANSKLRFECTAGAVSEFCRVDNVKVLGL